MSNVTSPHSEYGKNWFVEKSHGLLQPCYMYKDCLNRPTYYDITVKLVYKDHPWDLQNVVLIHKWFLIPRFNKTWKVHLWDL